MKTSLKFSLAALLACAVAACAVPALQVNSMRGSDASAADQAPLDQPYAGQKPGQLVLIARGFAGQPPLIPHSIDGLDEITGSENACLDCHISGEYRGKKMPLVGASHLLRPRSADVEPELNMRRWQCNSCHVPQIDAKPLVENLFKANVSP